MTIDQVWSGYEIWFMKLVFTVSNQKLSSLRNSQAGKKKSQSAEKYADFWNRLHGSKTHFDSRLRLIQADLPTFAWFLGDIIAWYANWVKSFQFNITNCVFCPRDYTLDLEQLFIPFTNIILFRHHQKQSQQNSSGIKKPSIFYPVSISIKR